ncbi:dolichol-phosphate mannosyltransferase [Enteropsectra breve]|nr:dolichol-phosphate mannosyltransferase [Enteropsectra breve]
MFISSLMYNVILPTYNEANNIKTMIDIFLDIFNTLKVKGKIIVIDDNSSDGTAKIVKDINYGDITLVERKGKLGLGSAYVEGIKHCTYEYTVIIDSDLQHDPFAVLEMHPKLVKGGVDIVTGTRYGTGGELCDGSFMRRLISCFANNLARYVLGLKTTDLTSSFRIYKTLLLKRICKEAKCTGFGFQMEAIARAEKAGATIKEHPITFYCRTEGESKISNKEFFLFLQCVIRLYLTI